MSDQPQNTAEEPTNKILGEKEKVLGRFPPHPCSKIIAGSRPKGIGRNTTC